MADVSSITVNGVSLDIKDASARTDLTALTARVTAVEQSGGIGLSYNSETMKIVASGSGSVPVDTGTFVAETDYTYADDLFNDMFPNHTTIDGIELFLLDNPVNYTNQQAPLMAGTGYVGDVGYAYALRFLTDSSVYMGIRAWDHFYSAKAFNGDTYSKITYVDSDFAGVPSTGSAIVTAASACSIASEIENVLFSDTSYKNGSAYMAILRNKTAAQMATGQVVMVVYSYSTRQAKERGFFVRRESAKKYYVNELSEYYNLAVSIGDQYEVVKLNI